VSLTNRRGGFTLKQVWRSKTSMLLAVVMSLVLVLSACGSNNNNESSVSPSSSSTSKSSSSEEATTPAPTGKLTVWGWDKSWFEKTQAEFSKKYPDVKFEFVEVAAGDYLKKIQTSIASGTDLPDIIWSEAGFRGAMYELNVLEVLSAEPYNFDSSVLLDFEVPLLSNSKGEIVGLEQSGSPGALAYKRDLATKYFGTDDPEQLAAMFPDWNAFVAKGREVYDQSGGKTFMLASLMDAYTIFSNQGTEPLVNGVTVNKAVALELFTRLQEIRDSNNEGKLAMWSPTWNASYSQDSVIFYPAANWSPQFVIKPNDKDSTGRWALMVPPEGGYPYGGTTIGIWKDGKNKSAAWTYLSWLLASDEGAEAGFTTSDYLLPLKSFFQDTAKLSSGADEFFGGQDLGKFWVEKVFPSIKSKNPTKYDQDIYSASEFILTVMEQDNKFGAEKALEKWEQELKKNHPELVFE
jgi:multiple sugar transport system substrate-binding protein